MLDEPDHDAIAEGAKRAILEALRDITDTPGADVFEFIRRGVREATHEWLEENRAAIIRAIADVGRERG